MQQFARWWLILLICWPLSLLGAAPVTINAVTDHWPKYSNLDGTGYYIDLLRHVFPEPDYQLELDIVPFSRALFLVNQQRVDVGLGFYRGDVDPSYYSEIPVEVDRVDAAVTPELAAVWKDITSLKQKKVQAMLAYRFDSFISVPMYYEESSELLLMLNHVNDGKIDALLDYKRSMISLASHLDHPRQYVIIENVLNPAVYFVFPQTEKGKRLKVRFDKQMQQLIKSGDIEQLFKRYVSDRERVAKARSD
ncbi:ABC transporter substrate-binding protein [Shewanella colwelliana]|uniref:ABC transporter substrate-binding protein n=1 Tax=Shewanella colwelliana TaxID=23 RepID=A0A1E5J031_SHECO|nr:transporter substrate-binding domain-containing protein [Shewanella colwelliana]OEG75658.1 ABC transporter substrate-binding protein [Shewanella colwelliana]